MSQRKKPAAWTRVGQALDARIAELRMTKRGVADVAGVDSTTLWKLRTGRGDELLPSTVAKIEVAVRWPAGTVDRMVAEPDFHPPVAARTDPERLSDLEAQVAELRDLLAGMADDLKRLHGA